MTPSVLHDPCQGAPTRNCVKTRAEDPDRSMRLSVLAATKASERPSGAQNGCTAFSVPGKTRDSLESIDRRWMRVKPSMSVTVYAIDRPSGEGAGAPNGSLLPSGARISNRVI